MEIEMISNLANVPKKKKQHTVARGEYLNTLKALMDSDNPALVIHCDSVEDAVNKTVGLYNVSNNNNIKVKVWRNGADVYVQKEEDKTDEC